MRGDRFLIPKKLKENVLQAAHEGHPGRESMLHHLMQSVWWLRLSKNMTEWIESCILCQVSVGSTVSPPMMVRETPNDIFEHVSMEFKCVIAGDYYLHFMIEISLAIQGFKL